jgi:putative PEP-CTERM system integral membrane protein
LPRLIEARNVFWSGDWLPARRPVSHAIPARPIGFHLPKGTLVVASPIEARPLRPGTLGGRFAVVLDRSRSMDAVKAGAAAALRALDAALGPDGDFDLYLPAASARGEAPSRIVHGRGFDVSSVIDFGGQSARELLEQFEALRGRERYDAVIVLTDRGGYELTSPSRVDQRSLSVSAPIWWVHVGGELPAAYDDATLQAIQSSGGGVTTSIGEALARIARGGASEQETGSLGVAGGYAWTLVRPGPREPEIDWAPSALAPLAAARMLATAIRTGTPGLDELHALARSVGIVSPYSSMIVVVNEAQWQRLVAAEQAQDRFEREVETGDKPLDLPAPSSLVTLSGTPEPAEWALLILVALGLLGMASMKQSFWARRDAARTQMRI